MCLFLARDVLLCCCAAACACYVPPWLEQALLLFGVVLLLLVVPTFSCCCPLAVPALLCAPSLPGFSSIFTLVDVLVCLVPYLCLRHWRLAGNLLSFG